MFYDSAKRFHTVFYHQHALKTVLCPNLFVFLFICRPILQTIPAVVCFSFTFEIETVAYYCHGNMR